MKIASYSKVMRGGNGGFLIPTHFLTTLGFVLVIYLDEIIWVRNERHYRPRLPFFFDSPCDSRGVLRPCSDSKFNKYSPYKLLTNKSHVRGVPTNNFWGGAQ